MAQAQPTFRIRDFGPILVYLALAILTIAAGLALRFVPLGLPSPLVRYGGSFLWAMMVYLLAAAFLPVRQPGALTLICGVFATLVELSRLYHQPEVDAFRLSLAGALLLGRVFNGWHIPIYWAGVLIAALLDRFLLRPRLAASPRRPRAYPGNKKTGAPAPVMKPRN